MPRPSRRRTASMLRCACETLEARTLLCGLPLHYLLPAPEFDWEIEQREATQLASEGGPEATSIVWTNRGQASDGFAANFGTSAAAGRAVVDAVLDSWERMITNWNRSDGSTTLQVRISITSTNGFGAAASPAGTAPADGKPRTGSITLQRGNNSANPDDSNGWFFDPTPFDNSEFTGNILNAYAGVDSAGVGNDLFSVVSAELAHVMGLISDKFNSGGSFSGYLLEDFATDTGIDDNAEGDGNGNFWIFEGATIDHLMTSYNSGDQTATSWGNVVHTAGTTAVGVNFDSRTWFGSEDTGNAEYDNERTLPSFVMTDPQGSSRTLTDTPSTTRWPSGRSTPCSTKRPENCWFAAVVWLTATTSSPSRIRTRRSPSAWMSATMSPARVHCPAPATFLLMSPPLTAPTSLQFRLTPATETTPSGSRASRAESPSPSTPEWETTPSTSRKPVIILT